MSIHVAVHEQWQDRMKEEQKTAVRQKCGLVSCPHQGLGEVSAFCGCAPQIPIRPLPEFARQLLGVRNPKYLGTQANIVASCGRVYLHYNAARRHYLAGQPLFPPQNISTPSQPLFFCVDCLSGKDLAAHAAAELPHGGKQALQQKLTPRKKERKEKDMGWQT